jgi:hypothetical protein
MSTISAQKQCLIIGKKPSDWPSGWAFPGPNPPGWPKDAPGEHFKFPIRYIDGVLYIDCLDEHDEATDLMQGQCFEISAFGERGGTVRLRAAVDQPWSRRAVVNISAPSLSLPLEFETSWLGNEKAFIRVELFGHTLLMRAELAF